MNALGRRALQFLLATFAGAALARAAEPAPAPSPATTEALAGQPSGALELLPSGLVVFVDPNTGRLIEHPTPAQRRALFERVRTAQAARWGEERDRRLDTLRPFAVPGGIGLNVKGLFTTATVVRVDSSGRLIYQCLEDQETDPAGATAGSPAPAADPVQER